MSIYFCKIFFALNTCTTAVLKKKSQSTVLELHSFQHEDVIVSTSEWLTFWLMIKCVVMYWFPICGPEAD